MKNTIRCRKSGLLVDNLRCINCDCLKWCNTQSKTKATIDLKNSFDETKIKHFGVWLTKSPFLKISRENYAVIDKRNSFWNRKYVHTMRRFVWKEKIPEPFYFEDDSCRIYTDEWCNKHQQECLKNYEYNMLKYEQITKERFDKVVSCLVNAAPLEKIEDLTLCNCSGIYILVLAEYKQLYIGQSKNIHLRVKQHWNKKKEFDRLLFGTVENSVISIDSFGALDTTDIYILPMPISNLYEAERAFVQSINPIFLINRVEGGGSIFGLSGNSVEMDFVGLPKRKQKKPIKEKIIKPVEIKIFSEGMSTTIEDMVNNQLVCVKLASGKFFGKIEHISKCYIDFVVYGKGDLLEIETQKVEKIENGYINKKRLHKKSIQAVAVVNEKTYVKNKAYFKVVSHKELEVWEF